MNFTGWLHVVFVGTIQICHHYTFCSEHQGDKNNGHWSDNLDLDWQPVWPECLPYTLHWLIPCVSAELEAFLNCWIGDDLVVQWISKILQEGMTAESILVTRHCWVWYRKGKTLWILHTWAHFDPNKYSEEVTGDLKGPTCPHKCQSNFLDENSLQMMQNHDFNLFLTGECLLGYYICHRE